MLSARLELIKQKSTRAMATIRLYSPVVPGVAKVLGVAGTSWFSLQKFFDWAFHKAEGEEKTAEYDVGTISAVILMFLVLLATIVTRYFNMIRKEKLEIENSSDDTSEDNETKATWLRPGIQPDSLHLGYKFTQLLALYFMFCSALSGFLSTFSLAQLISLIPGVDLNTKCEETKPANLGAVISLNLIALLFAYAAVRSFKKSNLLWMRDFYNHLILEKEIRQLSSFSWAVSITGTAIGTICIMFYNQNTYIILEKNSLCHMSDKAMIPDEVKLILSSLSALSNIIVNGLLIFGSVHNRYSSTTACNQEQKIQQELGKNPLFRKLNPGIKVSIAGNSLTSSFGTLVAVVELPESIQKNFTLLTYNPYLISAGSLCALFTFWNQWALTNEAYMRELTARNEEFLPDAQEPLNAASEGSESIGMTPMPNPTPATYGSVNALVYSDEQKQEHLLFKPISFKSALRQGRDAAILKPLPRRMSTRPWIDL